MDSFDSRRRVIRSTPVRADAEGLFIPIDDIAGAAVGDRVIVSGPDGEDERSGVIAEITMGSGEPFYRLELDQ